MKRGSVGLADVANSSASINIDVMATVRTHGDEDWSAFLPIIDMRNSQNSADLS